MHGYTRRDFLRIGASLAAALGLGSDGATVLADGLQALFERRARVLWLQGMSCTGCSVSFLNTDHPGPLEVLTEVISLIFHPTVSAIQGQPILPMIDTLTKEGKYYLILEGAVPTKMPEACVVGGKPLTSILPAVIRNAQAVIAAGTCTAFGGIPAAEGNPTGACSLKDFMEQQGLPTAQRLVNCPGCPVHPHSLVTTLAYVAGAGYPEVHPVLLTPNMAYGHSVHDECPRFHSWEKNVFAKYFGDQGCLFKLGCLGPLSHTDCPRRQWNGGVNWCVRAGAPCIGCTSENFARKRDFPFYRKGEEVHAVVYHENDRKGA